MGERVSEIYMSLHECSSIFLLSLETAPVSPFIVEGGTGVIHVFAMRHPVSGGGVSEPYSLSLWRHGRRSGPVLDALERRAGHARSYAMWELQ